MIENSGDEAKEEMGLGAFSDSGGVLANELLEKKMGKLLCMSAHTLENSDDLVCLANSKEIMLRSCYRVVGTCNGMVCLVHDCGCQGYNLVIWNPCIQKFVSIPEPPAVLRGGCEVSYGFGFDATGSDYKVVRLVTLSDQCESFYEWRTLFQVYSLARGSWSSLCSDLPPCQVLGCPSQVFVNGALHWSAMGRRNGAFKCFVLAFDVSSELFREIMLPKSLNWDPSLALRISVSGDGKSIAVFTDWRKSHTDYFLDIWEMKEYCMEKPWSKSIILSAEVPPRNLLEPLCFRKIGHNSLPVLVLYLAPGCFMVKLMLSTKKCSGQHCTHSNGCRNARSSIEECGSAHAALDAELLEALFCVRNRLEEVPNALNAFSEGDYVRADNLIEKDKHLARGSLAPTSSYKDLKQQYGGQVLANIEKMSYCGTTILAFITNNHLFIGADMKGSFRWGSMLYAYVKKVRKLAPHIIAAWAGNSLVALALFAHLKERIREYNSTQGSHVRKRIPVQLVASFALGYLRSKQEVKVSVLVAGYESTGLARMFKIDLNYRYPQPCKSIVLGSGKNTAGAVLNPWMELNRQSMSPEDATTLSMDSLIAASVTDPNTGGDALEVYQMTEKDELSLVVEKVVLAGYKDRITHLNLKPETGNRVLFCLTISGRFVSEQSLYDFFSEERVSKCINLGCRPNGRVIYRVVFRRSKDAASAYTRSCYEYERDVQRSNRKGRPNPYDPFLGKLEQLEVQVRWVNVLSVHVRMLVCYLHPLELQNQLRIITEIPVEYWPQRERSVESR